MPGIVIVYAFDPVDELYGRDGVLPVEVEVAERLVAECRVELVAPHAGDSMRFVAGSAANVAARDALRRARAALTDVVADVVGVAEVAPEPTLEHRARGRPRKVL